MKYVFNAGFNDINTGFGVFLKAKFCFAKFSEGMMNA